MEQDIDRLIWSALHTLLPDKFTRQEMEEILGLAGMMGPILGEVSGSKAQLVKAAAVMSLEKMEGAERRRFVSYIIEEMVRRRGEPIRESLEGYLSRWGWSFTQGALVPVSLLDPADLVEVLEDAAPDLVKAAQRFRDGDLSGALSAACAAVDAATHRVYVERDLGEPAQANSFQERVNRSLTGLDVLDSIEADLVDLAWSANDARMLKSNLRQSLSQAAFVMQTLRSRMGDVHGTKPTLRPLVFDSIKWAMVIVRLLS